MTSTRGEPTPRAAFAEQAGPRQRIALLWLSGALLAVWIVVLLLLATRVI